MKLTNGDTNSYGKGDQLIEESPLRQKKEPADVKCDKDKETPVRQPEMTEDNSIVSAYQEGEGERKDFEMKMLLRRQEAERKMKTKKAEDGSVDSLVRGVKDCYINKESKEEEDDLSGDLSRLSLKTASSQRQEPREDDERGDEYPQTEDEPEDKTKVKHDQRWAVLEEPSPCQESANKEPEENKKAVPRKPIGGVAVFPNRNGANNAYNQQQMGLNDPNNLAWAHPYQQQQQQQALTMPVNFPNYQNFQEPDQYIGNAGTGLVHHSKRGYDFEVQDVYSEAPKYIRPPEPLNNLDAPGTPLSPTSFNKSVSTVCTKQMAGATLLQQNTAPAPMLSPTHQQQNNWNNGEYPMHQLSQQNHHHQQQQQHHPHNFQQGFFPDYPADDLGSDLQFLEEALDGVVGGVAGGDADGHPDLDLLLGNPLPVHNGFQQQQQCYLPESSPPQTVFNYNNKGLNAGSVMTQHRNSQEDNGYATDQSPSHDSQFAPSPPSMMEASPMAMSSVSTSPAAYQNNWSPPPSNLSEMSQDSGVCSPMSEDGKPSTYGQIKSPRSVSRAVTENNNVSEMASPPHPSSSTILPQLQQQVNDPAIPSLTTAQQQHRQEVDRGFIVPPLQDSDSILYLKDIDDFNFNDAGHYIDEFVDNHLEELNDAVSVVAADVQKTLYQKNQQQQLQQQQQPPQPDQSRLVCQQQQQQQPTVASTPARMGYGRQVQQTTNVAGGSGCVMVNNAGPPMAPVVPLAVPPASAMMPSSRPMVMQASTSTTTNNNSKIMPAAAPTTSTIPTTSHVATASTPATPPPNAQGKLPIPATPRRSQNVAQGTTPMLGFPNNGQMTTLIVFNPPKPRFPNIAPKDPSKQNSDGTSNGSTNNTMASTTVCATPTTTTNNHIINNSSSINRVNAASPTSNGRNASASPPTMHQSQPIANNNNGNNPRNGNASPPQQNSTPPPHQNVVRLAQQNGLPPTHQNVAPVPQQNGAPLPHQNGLSPAHQNVAPLPQQNGVPLPQQNAVVNKNAKRLTCARKSVCRLVRDDLEYTDQEGDTNLHVAVCRTGRTDPYLIQALLERLQRENLTSMINAQNNAGQTPLYLAVSSNDPKKVKVLVDKGADVTLYAETRGYNGAEEKVAAIHCASSRGQGYLMTLKTLLTAPGIEVDQVDLQGHTALHCAILCHGNTRGNNQTINSLPIIETLVMAGANPNLQVRNGRTALMFALETGHLDIFEKLFSMVRPENREVCLKTQDLKGNSVLKIAERLKASLPQAEQQRLQNCLRRSIYQRSAGLILGNTVTGLQH